MNAQPRAPSGRTESGALKTFLKRAERLRAPQRFDNNELCALHPLQVECISKGKPRRPYDFGEKVILAVAYQQGLTVGARTFPGSSFDGHTLVQQLEQTTKLQQGLGRKFKQAIGGLCCQGADGASCIPTAAAC